MCTVTAVPKSRLAAPAWESDPLLLRLVCSRDELHTRAAARPPVVQSVDGRRVVMPLDPDSGGTWVAVNDCGLVFALLNVNAPDRRGTAGLSRGGIIPRLAGAASISDAFGRLRVADTECYRPFRLLMFDASQLVECWVEHGRLRHRRAYLQGAMMRTSSSLGDAVVEGPRRTLFRQFFRGASHTATVQDAFHDHQWPGREDVSVRMSRADASTVSCTTIEVSTCFATVIYRSALDDGRARVVLPLAGTAFGSVRRCS